MRAHRRDRNGLGVPLLSRTGSFIRRPSQIDIYGSNPRPLADPISSYDSAQELAGESPRERAFGSRISPLRARVAAWWYVLRYRRPSHAAGADD